MVSWAPLGNQYATQRGRRKATTKTRAVNSIIFSSIRLLRGLSAKRAKGLHCGWIPLDLAFFHEPIFQRLAESLVSHGAFRLQNLLFETLALLLEVFLLGLLMKRAMAYEAFRQALED